MEDFPQYLDMPQAEAMFSEPEYYLPENVSTNQRLRACMNCGLLKLFYEFLENGCDNCETVLKFKENPDRVIIFTSLRFEGIVGLTEFNHSWRSSYIPVDKFCVGIYALNIFGKVPDRFLEELIEQPWEDEAPPSENREDFRFG